MSNPSFQVTIQREGSPDTWAFPCTVDRESNTATVNMPPIGQGDGVSRDGVSAPQRPLTFGFANSSQFAVASPDIGGVLQAVEIECNDPKVIVNVSEI